MFEPSYLHCMFVTVCCLYVSVSAFEHTCTPELKLRQREGRCGNQLASMLELVCYLPPYMLVKRTGPTSNKTKDIKVLKRQILEMDDLWMKAKDDHSDSEDVADDTVETWNVTTEAVEHHEEDMDEQDLDDKTNKDKTNNDKTNNGLAKKEALSFLGKRSDFHEQNVVCECCVFHCTMLEMYEYCL